jgi:hypothetical protein
MEEMGEALNERWTLATINGKSILLSSTDASASIASTTTTTPISTQPTMSQIYINYDGGSPSIEPEEIDQGMSSAPRPSDSISQIDNNGILCNDRLDSIRDQLALTGSSDTSFKSVVSHSFSPSSPFLSSIDHTLNFLDLAIYRLFTC